VPETDSIRSRKWSIDIFIILEDFQRRTSISKSRKAQVNALNAGASDACTSFQPVTP